MIKNADDSDFDNHVFIYENWEIESRYYKSYPFWHHEITETIKVKLCKQILTLEPRKIKLNFDIEIDFTEWIHCMSNWRHKDVYMYEGNLASALVKWRHISVIKPPFVY